MAGAQPPLQMLTLNVKELNTPIKIRSLLTREKKARLYKKCTVNIKTQFECGKGRKKIYCTNDKHKKAGAVTLVSDKADFQV